MERSFPAMQIQNKFLKKYGPITWRDTKAIHDVTQKYIDELKIKCTSSKQKARELSGGNQQKVCLAKAFALQPRFLVRFGAYPRYRRGRKGTGAGRAEEI